MGNGLIVGLSGPFAIELCRPAWQAGGWSKWHARNGVSGMAQRGMDLHSWFPQCQLCSKGLVTRCLGFIYSLWVTDQITAVEGRSQTTLTSFWLFWPPTPIPWHFLQYYLAHVIKTTKFTNSESPIFCLLAWSTVGRDTLQFINWNHATFSNSF